MIESTCCRDILERLLRLDEHALHDDAHRVSKDQRTLRLVSLLTEHSQVALEPLKVHDRTTVFVVSVGKDAHEPDVKRFCNRFHVTPRQHHATSSFLVLDSCAW